MMCSSADVLETETLVVLMHRYRKGCGVADIVAKFKAIISSDWPSVRLQRTTSRDLEYKDAICTWSVGDSYLHLACRFRCVELVELLTSFDATDPEHRQSLLLARNEAGETAVDVVHMMLTLLEDTVRSAACIGDDRFNVIFKESDARTRYPHASAFEGHDQIRLRSILELLTYHLHSPNVRRPSPRSRGFHFSIDSWIDERLLEDATGKEFEQLLAEVPWIRPKEGQVVHNLRCFMAKPLVVDDGDGDGAKECWPVYRWPEELPQPAPFTPLVDKIRRTAEERCGWDLNYALVQIYNDPETGTILEHSDKTLDMEVGSGIVGVSFGATREFVFRPKDGIREYGILAKDSSALQAEFEEGSASYVTLLNNSIYCIGWRTNLAMTHQIPKDLRPTHIANYGEDVASATHGGKRISITFRSVHTYVDPEGRVFGGGAVAKKYTDLVSVPVLSDAEVVADALEVRSIYRRENFACDFDWEHEYGRGFSMNQEQFVQALARQEDGA